MLKQELEKIFPSVGASLLPLAGSALIGVWYMTGPFVAIAMDKYGCRLIVVGGLITCFCSMAVCYTTENFWVYTVAYGFVCGVGMGCVFIPPLTSISYYFDKKVSLAAGLAYTGSSFGYMILPIVERAIILLQVMLPAKSVPSTLPSVTVSYFPIVKIPCYIRCKFPKNIERC